MKFNQQLRDEIEKYKGYVILVEGKKDVFALKAYGFTRVYEIHKNNISIRERIEQIMQNIEKKDKICILTDLDRSGKKLYMLIKPILQESGARLDSSFRGLLIKAHISHIEGISNFMEKVEGVN